MMKRKKRRTVWYTFLTFFAALCLSSCGRERVEEAPEKALHVDYLQELEIPSPVQVVCDADSAWILTTIKDDPIRRWSAQTAERDAEQIVWQSEDGSFDLISIAQRRGILYAELLDRKDHSLVIREYQTGAAWRTVMTVQVENWQEYAVMGSTFFVNGSEEVYLANGDQVTRYRGKGEIADRYKLSGDVRSLWETQEGRVCCITAEETKITLYELGEGGEEEKWTLKQQEPVREVQVIGNSGGETLCLATDRELLFLDAVSGGLSVKTDLIKTGVSSVLAGYYEEAEGTLRLFGAVGNGEGLCYGLLRELDESGEQRTELVYGMEGGVNNTESSSIWRAISEFNQTNPDYYVTIKNYDNNIERLHADMAAGDGPDILDMTHSEYYESYAKNGYLEDLSPYLEQSPYRDEVIGNVLDAYRIDGRLYLLTPQVQLKGLIVSPEYEIPVENWNMDTFLELVEQNGWERPLLSGTSGDPETFLFFLLRGRQDEFIDWERGEASFETEEFVDMLKLCKEYAEADRANAAEEDREERERNALCREVRYGGNFSYYLQYGREYPVYGYPTSFGQAYEITACSDCCAIYSGSDQKEGAWAFLESLLWESNQRYSGITDPGFPICRSVLEELAEESKSMQIKSGEELLTISDAEIQILTDILCEGELRNGTMDPDIRAVIQEESSAYFAGGKDPWDVAHIIQNRVELILQE